MDISTIGITAAIKNGAENGSPMIGIIPMKYKNKRKNTIIFFLFTSGV